MCGLQYYRIRFTEEKQNLYKWKILHIIIIIKTWTKPNTNFASQVIKRVYIITSEKIYNII